MMSRVYFVSYLHRSTQACYALNLKVLKKHKFKKAIFIYINLCFTVNFALILFFSKVSACATTSKILIPNALLRNDRTSHSNASGQKFTPIPFVKPLA